MRVVCVEFVMLLFNNILFHETSVLKNMKGGPITNTPVVAVLASGCRLGCSSLRAHAVTVGTSTRTRICQNAAKQRTRDPTHSPYLQGAILVLVGPRSVQIQCRESPELSVGLPASVKEL